MTSASLHRLACVLLLTSGVMHAEEKKVEEPENKPGFFSRVTKGVTGIFTKDKEKADDKAKEDIAKPKVKDSPPSKSKAKKSDATEKPKSKASESEPVKPQESESKSAPKKNTDAAKQKMTLPVSKPEAAKSEKAKPDKAKAPESDKSIAGAPEDKAPKAVDAKMSKGDGGEFDDISSAFGPTKPATTTPNKAASTEALPPPPPLPASDGSWEVVKLDHDYVTAESIQRFYRFSTLKKEGNTVWFRSPTIIMKAVVGSQDLMINNIKFVLSYAVAESKGKALISRLDLCKLIDPVLLPSHISSSAEVFDTVVIDAGHGGHDSGAKGVYGYEKDYTLQMAFAVREALQKRGFKTVLTRSTDEFITLGGRVAIANATPRSIFVSLHFNSGGSSATGIETWALTPAGSSSTFMGTRGSDNSQFTGNTRDSENIALATAIHGMVIHRFKLVDRGLKRARWSVLTGCTRPGVLFEGGFVTNGTDCRLIAAPTFREAIATCIGDAIVNYRKALQPRVVQPTLK